LCLARVDSHVAGAADLVVLQSVGLEVSGIVADGQRQGHGEETVALLESAVGLFTSEFLTVGSDSGWV